MSYPTAYRGGAGPTIGEQISSAPTAASGLFGVPAAAAKAANGMAQLSKALNEIAKDIRSNPALGGDWSNTGFSGSTNRNNDTRPIGAPLTTPTRPGTKGDPGWSGDFVPNAEKAWAEAQAAAEAIAEALAQGLTEMFAPFTAQALGALAGFAGYKIGDAFLPGGDADAEHSRRNREQEGAGKVRGPGLGGPGRGGLAAAGRLGGALVSGLMMLAGKRTQDAPDLNRLHPWGRPAEGGCMSTHATLCTGFVDGASACLDGQAHLGPGACDGLTVSFGANSISLVQVYEHETLMDLRRHYAHQFSRVGEFDGTLPGLKAERAPAFGDAPGAHRANEPTVAADPGGAGDPDAPGGTPGDAPPKHRRVPPGKRVREGKQTARGAMGVSMAVAVAVVSEANDALDAIWKALPGHLKTRATVGGAAGGPKGDRRNPSDPTGRVSPRDKFDDLYFAFGDAGMTQRERDAFVPQMWSNLAKEAAEDLAVGSLARGAGRAAGRHGVSALTGPAM